MVAACDDDERQRTAECTIEADSDVDCVPRENTVGHMTYYNGHWYSCAWYNHGIAPSTTYVPPPSAAYTARSTTTGRASPPTSSRGGFGAAGSGGG